MMLLAAFWVGFLSFGLLMLGGIFLLNKLGLLGSSVPDFNSLEAQYSSQFKAQEAQYIALLEAHKSAMAGSLFKLAEDMNKSLHGLQAQISSNNTPIPEAPFYLPQDARPEQRFKKQMESETGFKSVGAAGVP